MPLDKTLVPIDFNESSVDTKADSKVAGKFTRIENMFKKRTGELRKRFGFDQLPSTVYSADTAITDDIYVADFNKELVAITSNDIYSYSESDDKWKEIDDDFKLWNMDSIKTQVAKNYYSAQIAVSDKYYIVVSTDRDLTSNLYVSSYSIYDTTTNSVIVKETGLAVYTSVAQAKVVSTGTYFIITYIDSNDDIVMKSIKLSDFSEIDQTITGTFKALDIVSNATYLYVYANDNGTCRLYRYNAVTLAQVNTISPGTTVNALTPMRLTFEGTNLFAYYCDYAGGNKKPYVAYYQADLTQIFANTALTVITCTESEMENFSGYLWGGVLLYVSTSAVAATIGGSPYISVIYSSSISYFGAISGDVEIISGMKTVGKSFVVGTSTYQMITQNLSTSISNYELYQDKCYLLNVTSYGYPLIEGVISTGNFFSGSNTAGVVNTSSAIYYNNAIYFPSIQVVNDTAKVISIKRIYQDLTKLSMPAKTNNELIIPGMLPLSYTGNELLEVNYSQYPFIAKYTNTGAGTGITTGKTYQYIVVASHIDRNGIKRRSALSPVFTMVKTDGFIWALNFIGTNVNRNQQRVEIYRTEGNGTIFYFVDSVVDQGGDLYFADTVSDATIITHEILYTTGGVLETELPSNASIVKILRNRLFLARCEDQDKVYYSKTLSANYPPEMSFINVIEFFDNEGSIVGCAELDEKLFFFKEDAIFYCFGELNNDLGQGQNITPLRIPGNIGLTDYQAIAEFSEGIIFKSARGFYLVDRGLNVSYIGAPVEYYNNLNITSSVLMTDYNQIRFTTSTGTCLVYDYFWKEWYVYTNILAISATNWEGSFVFAKSNGTFFKENVASWQDVATPIISKVQTSWLDVSGVQGLQRIYRGLILGEYRGAHTLKVSVATDYKPYYDEQFSISTAVLTGGVTNDSSYLANYSTGSTDSVYQFQFRPRNQKCQSMQLLLEDSFSTGNEGFTISGISLIAGTKKGTFKLPATKTMSPT